VWGTVFDLVMDRKDATALNSHVTFLREISSFIGTNVLAGRWGESGYSDSDKVPWEWSSSEEIYKVVRTKKRRASYGQSMVKEIPSQSQSTQLMSSFWVSSR